MRVFGDAQIAEDVAEAMYASESDFRRNPFAEDAKPALQQLHTAGIAVAILSDIHFDIRPAFAEAELSQFVDGYVLSFEHHAQKPDPAVFAAALATVGFSADETLMVGDRPLPDGGAAEHGITTLLLPTLQSASDQRLHHVLALCGLPI
jgi:FMN phosphatase YigB (HAD superfamily)